MRLIRFFQITFASAGLLLICYVIAQTTKFPVVISSDTNMPSAPIDSFLPESAKSAAVPDPLPPVSTGLAVKTTEKEESSVQQSMTIITGRIAQGDSLDSSLRRHGITPAVRQQIITSFRPYLDFRRLDANDTYIVTLDPEGKLIRCSFEASPLESYLLTIDEGQVTVNKDSINLHRKTTKFTGEISHSLFVAFEEIEDGIKLLYNFADIFSSRIDFNTETQKGDRFTLVVDKFYKNNKFIGYGRIKMARYTHTDGRQLSAYFYSNDKMTGYFDQDGQEIGTSFLRSPVPMGRVTSRFTYRRKHPITGKVQPHLGIDLAAPVGTPIIAAGDGKVEFIGRNGGNGLQIILSHFGGYKTYYGHLSRFSKGLKKGSKVNKKEVIGYVGTSGLSTGPHLDYRIQANGVFKDPFSVEFAPKSVLKGQQLKDFSNSVVEIHQSLLTAPEAPEATIQVSDLTITPDNKLILL